MRIPPNSISFKKSTEGINSNNQSVKRSGGAFLNKNESTRAKEAVADLKAPISREELASLASDLKSGVIDKDEMSNRFISTIVNNSIKEKLSANDREKLISYIAELFSHDQDFVKNLEKNLSQLT